MSEYRHVETSTGSAEINQATQEQRGAELESRKLDKSTGIAGIYRIQTGMDAQARETQEH